MQTTPPDESRPRPPGKTSKSRSCWRFQWHGRWHCLFLRDDPENAPGDQAGNIALVHVAAPFRPTEGIAGICAHATPFLAAMIRSGVFHNVHAFLARKRLLDILHWLDGLLVNRRRPSSTAAAAWHFF